MQEVHPSEEGIVSAILDQAAEQCVNVPGPPERINILAVSDTQYVGRIWFRGDPDYVPISVRL